MLLFGWDAWNGCVRCVMKYTQRKYIFGVLCSILSNKNGQKKSKNSMVARILSADLRICADMDPVSSLPQLPQSPRIEQIARLFAADANCCTLGLM